MQTKKATHTPGLRCWLWPNRTIGKRESAELREEHNYAVNVADELLSALEGFTAWLDAAPENYQAHFADRLRAARAAIAKAKGGAA